MPTNLPPEYYSAEERFRAAQEPNERTACLEDMLATIPKHKGTDKLRAGLRRKLSKLKDGLETAKKASRHKSVYHIEKEGPVQVVLIGAPNVGKSALITALTHATPKVSEYPFTTWAPVPGMMPVRDIQIQLVDMPPLSPDHVEPDMFNVIRGADLALVVVDLQARPLDQLDNTLDLLDKYRVALHSGAPGAALEGHAFPVACSVLVNKADDEAWDEEFEVLSELLEGKWPLLAVSATTGRNLDVLREDLFARLGLIRIYCKLPHKEVDMTAPFVLRTGDSVEDFARKVHKDFVTGLKMARIWGAGVHDGQQVGHDHVVHDGDVVELHL
ncbi:MAG: TGS domain-containing protein [bacterium]|nr:TGS domain-containing protein [bacterium]